MEHNPYAKFLDDRPTLSILQSTATKLGQLTGTLSVEKLDAPPAPGKWSIREIVAHLADCEIVFSFRLRQALSENHPTIQPFAQGVWAERYAAYAFASAMTLFQAGRNWNLKLLASVSEADKLRPTTHPERGTMTFWTIVETMAGHDINHLQQIERIVAS